MPLTVGQLLADRYRLRRRIAVGGMGEVWEAADERLDRRVAVKVLKAELSGDAEFLHRFRTEARTTASLNHPGVASVHDYGETAAVPDGPADTAYLVMELVEGEPLAAVLARQRRLGADQTLDILEQAGDALQTAHERGLVHRDVKPGNILITPSGKVKITDFGIAKAVDAAPVTRSGMVMGTAHYIAPEQAMGQEAGPGSDVYALGVVGYECLAGHRPFRSDNAVTVAMMHIRDTPPPLPPDVPPGARALIEATLCKDPRSRYATGGEFATAASAVRAGLPLPAPLGLLNQQVQAVSPPVPPGQPAPPVQPVPVVPSGPPMSQAPPVLSVQSGQLPQLAQNPPVQPAPQTPQTPQTAQTPQTPQTPQAPQTAATSVPPVPTSSPVSPTGPQQVIGVGTGQHLPPGPHYPPANNQRVLRSPLVPRPGGHPYPVQRRRTGVWVFVVLLLIAALVAGVWVILRALDDAQGLARSAAAASDQSSLGYHIRVTQSNWSQLPDAHPSLTMTTRSGTTRQ